MIRTCLLFVVVLCLVPDSRAIADEGDPGTHELGRTLFQGGATPACAICHTFEDAGATGTIGPNLDESKLTIDDVKKTLIEGTGVMPSFAESLTADEIEALAQYVVSTRGSD